MRHTNKSVFVRAKKNSFSSLIAFATIIMPTACGGGSSGGSSSNLVPPTSPPTPTPAPGPTAIAGPPVIVVPIAGATPTAIPTMFGDFTVSGSTVTGAGTTPVGTSDHFIAAAGSSYAVTIQSGAKLTAYCDNTSAATSVTACNSAKNVVIGLGPGSLTNRGSLQSFPSEAKPGVNYAQTDNVVSINNTTSNPTVVDNFGTIGNESGPGGFYGPIGYYGQGPQAGILVSGQATLTNEAGGYIGGNNAFFSTSGTGTLKNYGTIFGVNDAALTAYTITNYQNAGLVTGIMGYAAIHEYGNVTNYGYILGSDYAVLLTGGQLVDYGGPQVSGVTDVTGKPVYNGEITDIGRGASGPISLPATTGTPITTLDAVEMDGNNVVVTLNDQVINGIVYLPFIGGPIDGGFNGNENSATSNNTTNILNFNFPDISAAQSSSFMTGLRNSRHTNSKGMFYTGTASITQNGMTYMYEWANIPHLQFNGIALP